MNQPGGKNVPAAEWVEAAEAAELLGVKRETLYAYVSRGWIDSRSRAGSRARSYRTSDLLRLRAKSRARSGHGPVAAGALRWGEPVLDSAITEITPGGPRYRGHLATELAERGEPFERVAELLLTSELADRPDAWAGRLPSGPPSALARLVPADARPIDAALLALPAQATRDPARFDLGEEGSRRVARRIVRGLAVGLTLVGGAARARAAAQEPSVARILARGFSVGAGAARLRLLETTLVLCADHELNASSFAARVAASAGADPYDCAIAALAVLSGPRHGGMSERVAALVEEAGAPERASRVVRDRLRRGERIEGFGHPLYPDGDPRATPLLEDARRLAPRNRAIRTLGALVDALELVGGGRPNLDVGLCAVAYALRLPRGGATALFAAGRSAGWLAHAFEQRDAGFLLRPRARFVG